MSEPAGPIPVATTQTRPRAEPDAPAGAPKTKRFGRPRARQARVVVRKVGPWSVLRVSLLFYLCVMVVILGALVILWGVLDAIGALDTVTDLLKSLFAEDENFQIHGDWFFTRAVLIGAGMVVIWSLINVFVAFLYNLISDIVGGVEVTLSERR